MFVIKFLLVVLLGISLLGFIRYNYLIWMGRVTRWTKWNELSRFDFWVSIMTVVSALLMILVLILAAVIGR